MEELLKDVEKRIDNIQEMIHELAGHPIYGHVIGTRNNQIAGILRGICDNLIIIQQDIKLIKFKEEI